MARLSWTLTALAAVILATPAVAQVTVVGNSAGAACYREARDGHSTRNALRTCDLALSDEALSRRNRAATYINRGVVLLHRRNEAEAMNNFDMAIRLRPDIAEGYINRGNVLIRMEDYSGAIDSITRGLALSPQEPARAYYNRGIANEELGRYREAYNDYRRAAELAPQWSAPATELVRFRVN